MNDVLSLGNTNYISKSVKWFGYDSEKLYKRNKVEVKKIGINSNVFYEFNSTGFRCNELTSDPNIVFLGCSSTVGVGVQKEKTFSHIVSKSLNLAENNLGVGGSSNDTAFRLSQYWLKRLNPKFVVWLITYDDRFEIYDQYKFLKILASDKVKRTDSFYKMWVKYQINRDLHKSKNIHAVKNLCNESNVPLITLDLIDIPTLDLGRDLSHRGENTHQYIANTILEKINSL